MAKKFKTAELFEAKVEGIHQTDIDLPDFDIETLADWDEAEGHELELDKITDITANRQTRLKLKHSFRAKLHAKRCAEQLGTLPKNGESIHGILDGTFPAWAFAHAILTLGKKPISRLWVSTLATNQRNTDELAAYMDAGKILQVDYLISCLFRDGTKQVYANLRDILTSRGQRICTARTHAKVQVYEFANAPPIVLETSANMRSCANVEQWSLTRSKALAEFHKTWINEMIEQGDQR